MRATITSLVLLAVSSIPAGSQISGTILREPRTTFIRPVVMLSTVSPGTGQRGQQNLTVQLTGLNTHFSQGVTTLSMGSGITIVTPVNVVSPTSATAVINIDAATAAGARAVTVTSGAEVVSAGEGFSVTEIPDPLPKSCGSAAGGSLGAMSPGMSRTVFGLINLPGVEDWLMVSAPAGTSLKLTLAGVGPGSEFDVSAILMCSGSPIAATTAGVTPKEILLPPAGASQTFTIRIRASQWRAESSRFTLMVVAQ